MITPGSVSYKWFLSVSHPSGIEQRNNIFHMQRIHDHILWISLKYIVWKKWGTQIFPPTVTIPCTVVWKVNIKLEKKNTKVPFRRQLACTMALVMLHWVLVTVGLLFGDFYNFSWALDTNIQCRNYRCYSLILVMKNQNLTFIQLICQWKLLFDYPWLHMWWLYRQTVSIPGQFLSSLHSDTEKLRDT